jgi:hypothetical protein
MNCFIGATYCDSIPETQASESIDYPPQHSTDLKEVKSAYDSLAKNTQELGTSVLSSIRHEGIRKSFYHHFKFYCSIGIFFLLYLVYLKNRRKNS